MNAPAMLAVSIEDGVTLDRRQDVRDGKDVYWTNQPYIDLLPPEPYQTPTYTPIPPIAFLGGDA